MVRLARARQGKVSARVSAARLFARARGRDHQRRAHKQILQLPPADVVEDLVQRVAAPEVHHVQRIIKAVASADDSDIAPHRAAEARADIDEVEFALIARTNVTDHANVATQTAAGDGGDAGTPSKHQPLKQRVRRQSVGAMKAVARGFSAAKKPRNVGPSVEVGPNAADGVVRGGHDRDRRDARINAVAREQLEEPGEARLESHAAHCARVKKHIGVLRLREMVDDAAADDVARRKLGERMTAFHKSTARLVDEVRALATNCLADERTRRARHIQRRRVKLHELEVGNRSPRSPSHGDSVASSDARIGRLAPKLADAARRQHSRARPDDLQTVLGMVGNRTEHWIDPTAHRARSEEIQGETTVEEANARMGATSSKQSAGKFAAGRVAVGVHDAPTIVTAFARERQFTRGVAIKAHAHGDEILNLARPLFNERAHGIDVAQACACGKGVGDVLGNRVVAGKHRSNSALRPRGVGLL